jgi:hypothetical protein
MNNYSIIICKFRIKTKIRTIELYVYLDLFWVAIVDVSENNTIRNVTDIF